MYEERLEPFGGIEIIELPEGHGGTAKPDEGKTKKVEAESLLKGVPKDTFVIALDERGKSFSSLKLAEKLDEWSHHGSRPVVFLIGGPWGLDEHVRKVADIVLSIGPMTFPHGFLRVILMEQLYRTRMLWAGRAYHK
jgi:23S rRNA (pseudouridine1915-N3)-methyltransferase